ncbi:MAG: peptide synthetase [Ardenticatenaceae bacterium]|nr:peptide synthetase [Ardenticatenaceae bacterium]
MARFCARLRKQTNLPPVPIKKVYAHPTIHDLALELSATVPTPTEQLLSEVLADIMSLGQVSVDSHFFNDLGADSMVMARFCARLRKQTNLPPIPIKKVYAHPTISSLAAMLNGTSASSVPVSNSLPAQKALATTQTETAVSTPMYILCGGIQVLFLFGYFYLLTLALAQGYNWIFASVNLVEIFLRTVAIGNGIFLGMCTLPIVAKWLLIGRWQPQQFHVWSFTYFRFWVVRTLVRLNPLALFAGAPIYILYLRALGAKIGRNVVIVSPHVPVCTDLLTVGDNTVICKDAFINCYRAQNGVIQIGPVTLGRGVYIGEMTVLDIDTSLGDGAQLGHSSSLIAGQSIPAGEHRCGSPARTRTKMDYRTVPSNNCTPLRKIAFSVAQLLVWFVLSSVSFSFIVWLVSIIDDRVYFASPESFAFSQWIFYADVLLLSSLLFFGSILIRLIVVVTIPRLLNLVLKPDKDYSLYGFHYLIHRAIVRLTNVKFFVLLFGDSSYIVNYLRWIGYDLSEGIVQTGSNFGSSVKHDNPFLVSIGRGSMIADGLSMINAHYSNTSFCLSQVTIGADNFLGNHIAYPSQGKTGNNCLLATKVMVPVDGDERQDVGLLGSPSFEIPRSVQRDTGLNHPRSEEELGRQLAAKNKHNLITMGLFLLSQWLIFSGTMLLGFSAVKLSLTAGVSVLGLSVLLNLLLRLFFQGFMERASTSFLALQPQQCSIYDPYFWFHERFWKLSVRRTQLLLFDGTPLKSVAWRLLGAKIGKRLFDDGGLITERTMVTVGDFCTLNEGSIVQCHSQEDGGFKLDRVSIGNGCTIGVGSLVHYGVTMGDGAQLVSGAFLMKGEDVPPHQVWGDNPAMEVQNAYGARVAVTAVSNQPLERNLNSEIPVKQVA